MQQRNIAWLLAIALLVIGAIYVVWPGSGVHFTLGSLTVDKSFEIHQGLDLRGGLQVLLEADVPAGYVPTSPTVVSFHMQDTLAWRGVNFGVAPAPTPTPTPKASPTPTATPTPT